MKKLLLAFFIIDLAFIGLVLHLVPSSGRHIASVDETSAPDNLTEGQKNKWLLVKSFQIDITDTRLVLKTELLQSLCDVSSVIELVYLAENVVYSGTHPTVHHAFSCSEIKKDMSKNTLVTDFDLIKRSHNENIFNLDGGEQVRAYSLYDNEPFPKDWALSEIQVSGQSHFKINSAELNEVLNKDLKFTISSK